MVYPKRNPGANESFDLHKSIPIGFPKIYTTDWGKEEVQGGSV